MTRAAGGSLDPKGPAARSIADLWWLMFVVGTVVVAFVVVVVGVALFHRRRDASEPLGPAGRVPPPHEPGTRHLDRWFVVGGGVVLPVVVLSMTLGAAVWALRDVPTKVPSEALVVEIIGHQWWWEVRYPAEEIVTSNEVHVPVGRPVALRLTSADVIHSFWVPELGGKMDALPDGVTLLVLQADEPGEYRGRCAEFCGLHHTEMTIAVIALPTEDFESWVVRQRSATS